MISIYNNGQGIPVVEHKDEKMYVPSMIFGHLLTSSNYNDDDQKVTGGRNGYGAKLCNIFSNRFVVETSTKQYKRHFKQVWTDNMTKTTDPKIKDATGEDYTKITFSPDLKKFKMEKLDKDIVGLMSRRAFDVAASSRGVKVLSQWKKVTGNAIDLSYYFIVSYLLFFVTAYMELFDLVLDCMRILEKKRSNVFSIALKSNVNNIKKTLFDQLCQFSVCMKIYQNLECIHEESVCQSLLCQNYLFEVVWGICFQSLFFT